MREWNSFVSTALDASAPELEKLNADYQRYLNPSSLEPDEQDEPIPTQTTEAQKRLTIWLPSSMATIDSIASDYHELYPGTEIDIVVVDNYSDNLALALMSGEGPDIFLPSVPLHSYIKKGVLVDLRPHLGEEKELRERLPILFSGSIDGGIYYAPIAFYPALLSMSEESYKSGGFKMRMSYKGFYSSIERLDSSARSTFSLDLIKTLTQSAVFSSLDRFSGIDSGKFNGEAFSAVLEEYDAAAKSGLYGTGGKDAKLEFARSVRI